jgi:ketosteroid isomerase-like protein
MLNNIKSSAIILFVLVVIAASCVSTNNAKQINNTRTESESIFLAQLSKHLNAITNKDLDALRSTMSPKGDMQLILPGQEIMYTVDSFMKFHEDWFRIPNWTFDTQILHTKIGEDLGIAITEMMYREPERNGKPYFNRMIVSYGLEKINNNWYIIKDHATTVEKTGG